IELAKFMDAGVPVLWRPLHEAGGGWFWWGAKGPEPCLALYDIIYERLVNHHGLHNLIWVWSTPEETWYPGNDRVDIIGHDSYPGYFNYGNQKIAFDHLKELTNGEKLVALTENGPIPDPDACLDQGAPWLYFMSWDDLVAIQNSEGHIRDVFGHRDVLNMESDNYRTGTEWRSSLYPEGWKPGYKDKEGHFLHDFSHAGYHGGGVPIPIITENIIDVTLPPYSADNSGTGDATQAIQQALNDVGASGGGVVFLPTGTYRIAPPTGENQALKIAYSNTILRGAGADSTFLFNDKTYMRQLSVIYISPAWAGWFSSGGSSTKLRYSLTEPTKVIPVESVSGYKNGDKVIVLNTATEAFIAEHGMTGMWTTAGMRGVAHKRIIDSIDTELNLLILDTPTRYPLKTRNVARVHKAKPHLQECGIENLSIGMRENPKSGWGDNDYSVPGTGAYDAHFAQALKVEYTENSWIKGVHTYKPEVNTLDVHVLSNMILLNMCRHMTVDSCDLQKPQYEGGGGNGYMYTLHANDCLIQNSRANHSRHNYDFKYPYSNGNVILNCRAENSRYSSDFHMYLSMSNLLDHTMVNGDYLESVFRPYGGPIHGHSSTQSVFYNTVGEKYHPSKDYIVESRQYKNGYIIGTSGPAYQVKTDPVSGTQGGYAYDSSPRDFVEGVGQGIDLRPVSLYLDQLDRRLKDSVVYPGYALSLVVLNKESGDPVQGAEIRIYNEVGLTDSSGMVSFSEVPESFFLEVSHIQYSSLPLQQVLIFSDTTLSLKMEENTYKLNFEVLDESTLDPVRGVSVSLNENVDVTDNEGKVSFDTYTGTASYNIEKSAYKPVSGTVLIKNDTTLLFLLERSHADVKIRLREGSTPVNNVWVRLEGDSILSDGLGLAKFLQLPVRQEYNYSTFREGYVDQSGLLYLRTDTTIDVAMEKLSSAVEIMGSNESFKIWPNPTTGTLHFEMTGVELSVLSIYDARGAKVLETKASGNSETIELDKLPSGMYTVKLEGAPPSLIIKL
ncbi:MAG: glycosyl hydrolase, partial [Bacteroides sp.]|nr:glycosyl hydrolase [Bacteroides sp.]